MLIAAVVALFVFQVLLFLALGDLRNRHATLLRRHDALVGNFAAYQKRVAVVIGRPETMSELLAQAISDQPTH